MRVIVLGAGQVGYSIARYLSTEDNDITIVDTSVETLHGISDKLDIKPIHGFAAHPSVLKRANAHNADLLIAVTASDEVNMVACEIAYTLFNVKTKIARIRHQDYLETRDLGHFNRNMAIDVIISPELEVAKSLARSTQISGAFEVFSFYDDDIKVIGVRVPQKAPILNTPLRLLRTEFPYLDLDITCIGRAGEMFFPSPDEHIQVDDDVYFSVRSKDVSQAMEVFGYYQNDRQNLVIVGGGNIGLALAQQLEEMSTDIRIKVIEKNASRCTEVASHLKSVEVLNGDALDIDVLSEANVKEADALLALTDDDKVNILVSLLAKQQGANRSIALLNKTTYAGLVTSLGVDAIINPRIITVSTILQYVCQGRLRAIYSIADGFAEVIEAEARETSLIIGLTIQDISVRDMLHVCALIRDGDVIIRPEQCVIETGDILIMAIHKAYARKAEKLFHQRPVYL